MSRRNDVGDQKVIRLEQLFVDSLAAIACDELFGILIWWKSVISLDPENYGTGLMAAILPKGSHELFPDSVLPQDREPEIPVFLPKLPSAESLFPLLQEIDRNRWYTNRGPLLQRFELLLSRRFAVAADRVVAVANATAGLTLSLLAARSADDALGGLCIMPSWTHEATAVAVVQAGLIPWFHEVDERNWHLDPEAVSGSIVRNRQVRHVMVTAPFGAVVDPSPWADLAERFGVGVTIDAASCFDRLRGGPVDAVVSLHATKVLGIGEGGIVVARDAGQASRIRDLAQLGLTSRRTIPQVGMNAKLSEYAAAVGLAALAAWPERRATLMALRNHYATRLGAQSRIGLWLPTGISSTLMVRLPERTAAGTAAALAERGIASRRWWHAGCHRQPAFADLPRQPLPVTESLADSILGLPFHEDLDGETIDRIVDTLIDVSQRRG